MIQSVLRGTGAIIAALIVAMALIITVEVITGDFQPFPGTGL